MIAKKCDRCGAYYDAYGEEKSEFNPNGFEFLNIDTTNAAFHHHKNDLCQECCKELVEWFTEKNGVLQ